MRDSAAIGVRDVGPSVEARPLHDPVTGLDVVFSGRLDNRDQLRRDLRLEDEEVSDSKLALLSYLEWDRQCFKRLLGPFSMALIDTGKRRLIAARDPLGDRTLCYHRSDAGLVIATEASAILRHPAVSPRLDEATVSRFLAVEAPLAGATFFADVHELPPGHLLTYDASGDREQLTVESYWPPTELEPIRYRDDEDYVEHFRSLLAGSVRCRLPSEGAPAVLMSGGLDSTSVAALAARELAQRDPDVRLPVISWVFDELEGADERAFMDPMIDRFRLAPHRILGDNEWPLRDLPTWPLHRDAPAQGLYCRLQNRAYATAAEGGSGVLLTGEYGDHLYQGGAWWLRDLLAEGRWTESWRHLKSELGDRSLWQLARAGRARGAVARAIGYRRRPSRPWLTSEARRLIDGGRAANLPGVLDPRCARATSLEASNAGRAGVDVRRPFRDRRLIEFVMSIPAHLLYRPGWTKWILRRAMAGILPERVRLRRQISSLLPLAARGLVEREAETVRNLLSAPDALWQRYVRSDWLTAVFPRRLRQRLDGIESVVPWQCLCLELWNRRVLHGT